MRVNSDNRDGRRTECILPIGAIGWEGIPRANAWGYQRQCGEFNLWWVAEQVEIEFQFVQEQEKGARLDLPK